MAIINRFLILLFFVITSAAQAVGLPTINYNPTGYDLAEALGGKYSDYRVIQVDGCLVQYKRFIHTKNSKVLGSKIEEIDLKEALEKPPFCKKLRLLVSALLEAKKEADKEENHD